MREGGPDNGKTRRQILRLTLAGAIAATAGSILLKQKKEEEEFDDDEPTVERTTQSINPANPEEIPHGQHLGMRRVIDEQVKKGDAISFGVKEQAQVDADWTRRMKGVAFVNSIQEARERINAKSDTPEHATYLQLITKIFEAEKVPAKLLHIVFSETWFRDKDAKGKLIRSSTGAIGPFQFQAPTALEYGLIEKDEKGKVIRDDRLDPIKSARAAARYLKHFADAFMQKGTPENEAWDFAVLSYNGGYAQTYYIVDPKPTMEGFRTFLSNQMQKTLVNIKSDRKRPVQPGETLKVISHKCGISARVLYQYNPGVNWKKIVPNQTIITIPGTDTAPLLEAVGPKDTIAAVANRLGTTEQSIRERNPKVDWQKLQPGSHIEVPHTSPVYGKHVHLRKMNALGGFIENVDYLAKTKAIIDAVAAQ